MKRITGWCIRSANPDCAFESLKQNSMDQLVRYLSANFGKPFTSETNPEIARLIKRLNREDRGELRYRLFNESRKLDAANNGQQAIFWLQNCFELIDKYMFHIHKVYFSPGTDILESLSVLLSQATMSLDLCIFTITDGRLAADLLDCLERGIKVRIITDNDKMYDNGSVIQDLKNARKRSTNTLRKPKTIA